MIFICKDVKVENRQYHYYGDKKTEPRLSTFLEKQSKQSKPRIRVMKNKKNQQTQYQQQPVNEFCPAQSKQSTLRERIRKKQSTMQTTLMNTKQDRAFSVTRPDYSLQNFRSQASVQQFQLSDFRNKASIRQLHPEVNHKRLASFHRQTLVTNYNEADEFDSGRNQYILEESLVIERNIEGKFVIVRQTSRQEGSWEYLAEEINLGCVVSLKYMSLNMSSSSIFRQLQIYSKIGKHPNILSLYQVYQQQRNQILVKQPYCKCGTAISGEVDEDRLENNIANALQYLEQHKIYLNYLQAEDICETLGAWKIRNLSNTVPESHRIPVENNVRQLKLCFQSPIITVNKKLRGKF